MLRAEYTKAFERDVKRLKRRHADFTDLKEVIRLVLEDTGEARETLWRRHRAHMLTGDLAGVMECHVGNAGDWLAIWVREDGVAVFMRTGSHDELFGKR
ncbi:type II toxin-antitoxin system YafQ family toxin [Bifidobacterium pullorum subsp. saeculare]|uniref:Type II toxin-antitoxin system YafQ family toxin n=1 Tax=Bifidobacterium pullorum subsp. saeculare TaxID=78257 RepID=A0A938WXB7_9BIFI|nr:type II toxin-antitoxin system YafQ family toxin [Bifidobacterium pullorum]MBM6699999.1 type II toxin-antitoxin system YafQ family toxin [Bifidobacterium pullorum subsp. saeculare]